MEYTAKSLETKDKRTFNNLDEAKAEAQHMSLETGTAYVVENANVFPVVIYWDGWAFLPSQTKAEGKDHDLS